MTAKVHFTHHACLQLGTHAFDPDRPIASRPSTEHWVFVASAYNGCHHLTMGSHRGRAIQQGVASCDRAQVTCARCLQDLARYGTGEQVAIREHTWEKCCRHRGAAHPFSPAVRDKREVDQLIEAAAREQDHALALARIAVMKLEASTRELAEATSTRDQLRNAVRPAIDERTMACDLGHEIVAMLERARLAIAKLTPATAVEPPQTPRAVIMASCNALRSMVEALPESEAQNMNRDSVATILGATASMLAAG